MLQEDLADLFGEALWRVDRGPVVEPVGFEAEVGGDRVEGIADRCGDASDRVDVAGCFAELVERHERSADDDQHSELGVSFLEPGREGSESALDRWFVEQGVSHDRAIGHARRARCSGP